MNCCTWNRPTIACCAPRRTFNCCTVDLPGGALDNGLETASNPPAWNVIMHKLFLSSLLLLLLLSFPVAAQTSYPMVTHISPVAVQRGKTTEVTVSGQMNFFGIYKALFEGEGISAL